MCVIMLPRNTNVFCMLPLNTNVCCNVTTKTNVCFNVTSRYERVSFAKEPYKTDDILQKRPII